MAQDAVIIRFSGSPPDLAKRYGEGLRRFAASGGVVRPQNIFLARDARDPNVLVVVLLWPEGVDHSILGNHFLRSLSELGLPRPSQVDHLAVDTVGWEAVAALSGDGGS
jgi:hypothetical protein